MLAQTNLPASHVGEDQSSRQLEARVAHWSNLAVQLLLAAKGLANDWLQDENDDVSLCFNAEYHARIRALFEAIKSADNAGLSDACAVLAAADVGRGVFWSVTGDKYEFTSLPALLADAKSDFLRPGDFVYHAQAVGRYKLTETDFTQATAVNAPARDPRVIDMFEAGGAA